MGCVLDKQLISNLFLGGWLGHRGTNAGANGIAGSAGPVVHVCEFSTWYPGCLGAAPSPHREQGAQEVYSCGCKTRERQREILGIEVDVLGETRFQFRFIMHSLIILLYKSFLSLKLPPLVLHTYSKWLMLFSSRRSYFADSSQVL